MKLRPDIDCVMERTKNFNQSETGVLIQIEIADIQLKPKKPLNSWNFPDDLKDYLDCMIDRLEEKWVARAMIDDDLVPAICPWFGIAEHSAFVAGEVVFLKDTSDHKQLIKDWGQLNELELRNDNQWFCMVMDGLRYLKQKSDGRFAVKLRGGEGPMDIANTLRGNDFFTDFYDYPDELHQLMGFCTKAVQWTLSNQKSIVGDFYGGVLSGMDIWLPEQSIGPISEDASTMCSPKIYAEFGKPYTEKFCADYRHVLMHTHGLGRHNLENIASIPNIDYIEISNDPKCPRAIEVYKKKEQCLKEKTVVLGLTKEEIKNNINFLLERKTIIKYTAATLKDAEETIQLIRKVSNNV